MNDKDDIGATIDRLYKFIATLVTLLEDELEEVRSNRSKSAIKEKKNITEILNKLVSIIIQLNKLVKDSALHSQNISSSEDLEIIGRFLRKYE